uniref:Si:ch73-23l24.1 n=1 Tax=Sinocyclocheilus anshuiensis TaxID=1608454 RepID=A0A671MRG0_9TELE
IKLLQNKTFFNAHYSLMNQDNLDTVNKDKQIVPNWALTSSDFFAWIEELRSHAGYDKIEELARTFWAHFPSASRLGYDPPAPEE